LGSSQNLLQNVSVRLQIRLKWVVNRNRKHIFRCLLAHEYIVELSPDFSRFLTTQTSGLAPGVRVQFLVENAFANVDAIVANVTPGPAMSLRTSPWLLPQKEHIVRLHCAHPSKLFQLHNHLSRADAFSAAAGNCSGATSFRDFTTSSTSP
jgi:hypothetical protein